MPICRKWSEFVTEEFFAQGEKEKTMGLPISPNMDRDTTNPYQLSVEFNDIITRPFFDVLSEIFPMTKLLVDIALENRSFWEDESKKWKLMKQGSSDSAPVQPPAGRSRKLSIAAGTIDIPDNHLNALKMSKNSKIAGRVLGSIRPVREEGVAE